MARTDASGRARVPGERSPFSDQIWSRYSEVGRAPAVHRNVTWMSKEGKRAGEGKKREQSNVVTPRPRPEILFSHPWSLLLETLRLVPGQVHVPHLLFTTDLTRLSVRNPQRKWPVNAAREHASTLRLYDKWQLINYGWNLFNEKEKEKQGCTSWDGGQTEACFMLPPCSSPSFTFPSFPPSSLYLHFLLPTVSPPSSPASRCVSSHSKALWQPQQWW